MNSRYRRFTRNRRSLEEMRVTLWTSDSRRSGGSFVSDSGSLSCGARQVERQGCSLERSVGASADFGEPERGQQREGAGGESWVGRGGPWARARRGARRPGLSTAWPRRNAAPTGARKIPMRKNQMTSAPFSFFTPLLSPLFFARRA